jgi:uncharacterized protein
VKFSLDDNSAVYVIRAYDKGIIKINDTEYRRSLVVSNETIVPDWEPGRIDDLVASHMQTLLELDPEVIVLGTGDVHRFPPQSVFAEIYQQRIGLEIMTTEAACRTYNILTSENRKVVAGLILDE